MEENDLRKISMSSRNTILDYTEEKASNNYIVNIKKCVKNTLIK